MIILERPLAWSWGELLYWTANACHGLHDQDRIKLCAVLGLLAEQDSVEFDADTPIFSLFSRLVSEGHIEKVGPGATYRMGWVGIAMANAIHHLEPAGRA